VLMLVDGAIAVSQIADTMFQPNERVIDLIRWAASKGIVDFPEGEVAEVVVEGQMGRYVKCPKFDGDPSKISTGDAQVIQLCDGTKTTEEIAQEIGVPHSKVIEVIARNRKHGLKMIGKTV
ncbi:MAG: hypothetical protein ACFE7R_11480, partial [Candidatus Hodarchaeota archaeon]